MASLDLGKVEELFADLARHNVGITIEGGGEPTVHPDFVRIVSLAQRYKLDIGLISNGVKPLGESALAFKWIRVSIDASRPEEYVVEKGLQHFGTVLENVRTLGSMPERPFLLGIGYVLTKRNSGRLPGVHRPYG